MFSYYSFLCFFIAALACTTVTGQPNPTKPAIGVCVSDDGIARAKDAGLEFVVPSVSSYLKPNLSDSEYLAIMADENILPVFACNIFFPSHMKCVGPDSDLTSLLAYAKIVFKRAKQVGVPMIVFGSGGARTIPNGFKRELAIKQFTELCVELSKLAKQYNIRIALENLNKEETNLINTVEEAMEICRQVNMPNFGVNVDIYHMLKEGESASNILKARNHIFICDIAEPKNRTPPGIEGTDFSDYLSALMQIDYHGGIAIEARWDDFSAQATQAYQTLSEQLNAIY